jgi:hypothetical protein
MTAELKGAPRVRALPLPIPNDYPPPSLAAYFRPSFDDPQVGYGQN